MTPLGQAKGKGKSVLKVPIPAVSSILQPGQQQQTPTDLQNLQPPKSSRRWFHADDTQTETMKGDNTQSDTNPFGADSDNDHDDGVFQQTPAAAGLPKLGSRNRRLTIEPGDHEKLLLTEGSNIYATVLTDEDIVQSFTESPNYWCTAMRTSVKNAEKLRQRNLQMETEVEQIRASARTSVNNVKTIKNQLEQSDAQVARLRQLRDSYKEHYQNLSVEFQKLKEKIAAKRPAKAGFVLSGDSEDEDEEDRPESRHAPSHRPSPFAPVGSIRSGTGAGRETDNKKYPDVTNFYGTHDRDQWEPWLQHLYSKFRQSWSLFSEEQDKIEYVRDHCKATAYEVIKTRAEFNAQDPYTSVEDIIADLDAMFGEFDKTGKANALLHDPNFNMGVIDKNETFEIFYSRFAAAIAPLNYSEEHRIFHLERTISPRLKWKIADGVKPTSFKDLVARLRQLDQTIRQLEASTPGRGAPSRNSGGGNNANGKNSGGGNSSGNSGGNGGNSNTTPSGRGNAGRGSGNTGSTGTPRPYTYTYSPALIERLKKENRCFKCLEVGHNNYDKSRPCKGKQSLNKEQVEAKLAAVGWEVEDYTENTKEENSLSLE